SNLGDRAAHLEAAIREIAALPETTLLARSSLYESAPLDADGADYLNAVVKVRTSLAASDLLAALQGIETRHGRQRPYVNAPRSLDLDLLLHGQTRLASPELVLPHPRLHERAFVLLPLVEISAGLCIPGRGGVEDLLRGLGLQRVAKFAGN
ncbi:MAG: 2-amino-4-hydroxy-6-hydroxymethyldihydropteridine diphosphokinase, partial [Pseudomonadota bacterium]|nr:2-amino-4-hydroxy-6-hydroxymethyldihydropteridine diphosphokinase [Pseudomonadota bacterium]